MESEVDIICFHNPDEENGYLSNWFLSTFQVNNQEFSSMEQYMMFEKAKCFQDDAIAYRIMQTNDVAQIKLLGRAVSNFNELVWNGMRQIIVYEGLLAKFSQNSELAQKLLKTENAIFVECAVHNRMWGIGLSMQDQNRYRMQSWRGQNLLGYSLMMVRDRLRKTIKN